MDEKHPDDEPHDLIGYGPDCCGEDDTAFRRARVDAAIARLDAEVAAHEGDDELVCSVCGRPYALHGIGCPTLSTGEGLDPDTVVPGIDGTTGLSLGGPSAWDAPGADPSKIGAGAEFRQDEPEEARFGERLRAEAGDRGLFNISGARALELADAIDHDADAQRTANLRFGAAVYRRQVEEAVERGRYSATAGHPQRWKDVLDAEPFLEALGAIFGERPEPVLSPGFVFFECPECGFSSVQPDTFSGSEACPLCAGDSGHDVRMRRRACLAGDRPEGLDARVTWKSPVEHEPAHDRRERASARHEDSTGRVEGVDR